MNDGLFEDEHSYWEFVGSVSRLSKKTSIILWFLWMIFIYFTISSVGWQRIGQGSLKYQTIKTRMISVSMLLGENFWSPSCSPLSDNAVVFQFLLRHLVGLASRDPFYILETRSCPDRQLRNPLLPTRLTYGSKWSNRSFIRFSLTSTVSKPSSSAFLWYLAGESSHLSTVTLRQYAEVLRLWSNHQDPIRPQNTDAQQ